MLEEIGELYIRLDVMWADNQDNRRDFNKSKLGLSELERVQINEEFKRLEAQIEGFMCLVDNIKWRRNRSDGV